jgi:hypothetical protein
VNVPILLSNENSYNIEVNYWNHMEKFFSSRNQQIFENNKKVLEFKRENFEWKNDDVDKTVAKDGITTFEYEYGNYKKKMYLYCKDELVYSMEFIFLPTNIEKIKRTFKLVGDTRFDLASKTIDREIQLSENHVGELKAIKDYRDTIYKYDDFYWERFESMSIRKINANLDLFYNQIVKKIPNIITFVDSDAKLYDCIIRDGDGENKKDSTFIDKVQDFIKLSDGIRDKTDKHMFAYLYSIWSKVERAFGRDSCVTHYLYSTFFTFTKRIRVKNLQIEKFSGTYVYVSARLRDRELDHQSLCTVEFDGDNTYETKCLGRNNIYQEKVLDPVDQELFHFLETYFQHIVIKTIDGKFEFKDGDRSKELTFTNNILSFKPKPTMQYLNIYILVNRVEYQLKQNDLSFEINLDKKEIHFKTFKGEEKTLDVNDLRVLTRMPIYPGDMYYFHIHTLYYIKFSF